MPEITDCLINLIIEYGAMDWTVTEAADYGLRLDKHLAQRLPDLSRTRVQDLIKEGHITLNGRTVKAGAILKHGDAIHVTIPE
ncbi:MAG: S4 domain-containing protein, partial [bacterium]